MDRAALKAAARAHAVKRSRSRLGRAAARQALPAGPGWPGRSDGASASAPKSCGDHLLRRAGGDVGGGQAHVGHGRLLGGGDPVHAPCCSRRFAAAAASVRAASATRAASPWAWFSIASRVAQGRLALRPWRRPAWLPPHGAAGRPRPARRGYRRRACPGCPAAAPNSLRPKIRKKMVNATRDPEPRVGEETVVVMFHVCPSRRAAIAAPTALVDRSRVGVLPGQAGDDRVAPSRPPRSAARPWPRREPRRSAARPRAAARRAVRWRPGFARPPRPWPWPPLRQSPPGLRCWPGASPRAARYGGIGLQLGEPGGCQGRRRSAPPARRARSRPAAAPSDDSR